MKKIIYLTMLFLIFSCSINKSAIIGKYEYRGLQTIDSIIIKENVYIHKIFNKDGKLMYQGTSEWEYGDNRIIFLNFYNNEDYNLTEFLTQEEAKDFLIRLSCPVTKSNKKVMIEVNTDENIIYYKSN